jgi:hypothetical protein
MSDKITELTFAGEQFLARQEAMLRATLSELLKLYPPAPVTRQLSEAELEMRKVEHAIHLTQIVLSGLAVCPESVWKGPVLEERMVQQVDLLRHLDRHRELATQIANEKAKP